MKFPGLKSSLVILCLAVILMFSCNREGTPDFINVDPVIPNQVHMFNAGQVSLLDGPFSASMEMEKNYLASLDVDRLLAPYLREAGLEMKAENYPGWETTLPGVALASFMSGASRVYAQTGDTIFLGKLKYILDELERCQVEADGYLLGCKGGQALFKKLTEDGYFEGFNDGSAGHAVPFYVMDKVFAGLMDVYNICDLPRALIIADRLAEWLEEVMKKLSDQAMDEIMKVEYGGMNRVLAEMYILTGKKEYLRMSERWQDKEVTVPMTRGEDVLTGKHANTQFPKMAGLAVRYPYTGKSTDLFGAKFFWNRMVNHSSYATGGNSEGEEFSDPDMLAHTLTQFTEENCNEYNMLKLTSLLYCVEPEVEYADYTERTLWNHILAAQHAHDGRVCYYLPLMPGAERDYQTLYTVFTCCVCTGMDSYVRHAEYIYAYDDSSLFVNQFIASWVDWEEQGVRIMQETDFPNSDIVTLKIESETPSAFRLKIRDPYWLASDMEIKLNGKLIDTDVRDGYLEISRQWNNGDELELHLPMSVRTESLAGDDKLVALFYGPILLSAELDPLFARDLVEGDEAPMLLVTGKEAGEWLKPAGSPLEFITRIAVPEEFRIIPFFRNKAGNYTVYFQAGDKHDWLERQEAVEDRRSKAQHIDRRTRDQVFIGNEENEKEHGIQGSSYLGKGNKGINSDLSWRTGTDSLGFSYRMRLGDASPNIVYLQFMGPAHYENWDCRIMADTIQLEKFTRGKEKSSPMLITREYEIPGGYSNRKDSVRIRFIPSGSWQMPRVCDIRILGEE